MVKSNMPYKKVAIVHDWLIGGGAEKVVEQLHYMFPDAPIYTSYATEEWRQRLNNKVITGFLQHYPFNKLRKFLPLLRIWWFSSLNFDDYDLVISSSGAEAKGINTPPKTMHINYCHAPTHYYWGRYNEYINNPGFGLSDPIARLGLKLLIKPLQTWDFKAAQKPNIIIANSTHIQSQIKKYYKRDSTVVFPPVDINRFKKRSSVKRSGFLVVGRQTPYKKIDLAVKACTSLNLPLTVIGDGPQNAFLQKIAGPSINFITNASDQDVEEAFRSASGFIFPGLDDFGITPVEALASGCPVIAFKAGGALDYIKPNKTGIFFEEQSVNSLTNALKKLKKIKFNEDYLVKEASKFSSSNFKNNMMKIIKNNNE